MEFPYQREGDAKRTKRAKAVEIGLGHAGVADPAKIGPCRFSL